MGQRDRISAAAWLVVRDAHIAEDIFQNVALKAMAKEVTFDSDGALMSWAFITARREGIDWLRRQKNAPVNLDETILELLEAEWANESLGQAGSRSQALRDCLSELPAKSRELLKLRYFDGQRCEEVAASLGTKLDAVYKRLSRLHQALEGLHRDQTQPSGKLITFQSMALNEEQQAQLLRHLNGELSPTEAADVAQLLKEDAEARDFLRGVAEQAVVVADVERLAQHREPAKVVSPVFNPAKWAVAAAIILVFVGSFLFTILSANKGHTAEVVAIHGPNQHLAADGVTQPELAPGTMLKIGDKLRTLSSRSWVKLKLNDGSYVMVTGRSSLRLIRDETHRAFLLRYGNLWATINTPEGTKPFSVLTETARINTSNAQFDIETKFQEISVVSVDQGSVTTERLSDGSRVEVAEDHQTIISMSQRRSLIAKAPARAGQPVELQDALQPRGRVRQVACPG